MESEVTAKKIAGYAVILTVAVFALFDVSVNFKFSMPHEKEQADAEQEARYQACYDERDAIIHRIAFGTIDNPDVQKEFIFSSRARAATECRTENPQQMVKVSKPFRFNVFDFSARLW